MTDSMHAHRKNLYKGEAASHVAYITRQGRHKRRSDLLASGELNLPAGAESFHGLCVVGDGRERSRGIVAKEWVLSVPRALGHSEAVELTKDWAAKLAQAKPAQWVIHDSSASDGGRNVHAHIVALARVPDSVARPVEQIFARHNPADRAAGGWKKEREAVSREGFAIKLKGDRQMCAAVANEHLARHGHEQRVDARSFAERGLQRTPGVHLYPAGMRKKKEDGSTD